MSSFCVVLYYKYVPLSSLEGVDMKALLAWQEGVCQDLALKGRVRLAQEGINGTLGGSEESVFAYVQAMNELPYFRDIDWKISFDATLPFQDLLVRHVKEIVSLEVPDSECNPQNGGQHLSPQEFHRLLDESDATKVALIDVRNIYEYNIGHFEHSMNPETRKFSDFPAWCRRNASTLQQKDKVLMYCTGGIRCEKASAYLKTCLGLPNVYQLSGGIHRYLEAFPSGGHFKGKNFVFDNRVSMASKDSTIVGRCEECHAAYDFITGTTRCYSCRMHVILCVSCQGKLEESDIYCAEHASLRYVTKQDLTQRKNTLLEKIVQQTGRENKGRRRTLKKQLDMVENRLKTLISVELVHPIP